MKTGRLETGKAYKINGRIMVAVEEVPVGERTGKYIQQAMIVRGKRGATYLVEIRHGGTAYWIGATSNKVEEISHFEQAA